VRRLRPLPSRLRGQSLRAYSLQRRRLRLLAHVVVERSATLRGVERASGDVDQDLTDGAALDGSVGVCCSLEREAVQR
jgi:hypothetical protein